MPLETQPRALRTREFCFGILFALAYLVIPVAFGELYPFTIAPMFRDAPQAYCEYDVLSADGVSLPLREFALHRNYDGNPVGFGAGVRPQFSLDQFGVVPSEQELRAHVSQVLASRHPDLRFVDVVQTVIGPVDAATVGVTQRNKIRVYQHAR